jgi:hypothetical protein
VDDTSAVGEAHSLADLRERLQQPRPVGGFHFGDQGLPGDKLHGEEWGAVGQRAQGVNRRDARMRQARRDLRLADEAVGVGPRQQNLEDDVAVEAVVERGEDPTHAAAGDFAQHPVAGYVGQVGGALGRSAMVRLRRLGIDRLAQVGGPPVQDVVGLLVRHQQRLDRGPQFWPARSGLRQERAAFFGAQGQRCGEHALFGHG